MAVFVPRSLAAAMGAAVVVFLGGFGALFVLHLATPSRPGLPGLFHYLSATWGDGLLLPCMTGALVFCVRGLPPASHERWVGWLAGVLGVLLGAWTQVQWLRDDAPGLNWTLPRPHHFTVAGWYHAGFLIAMSGATAVLWAVAIIRATAAREGGRGRRTVLVPLTVALFAGLIFVALLVADAAPSRKTGASTATLLATVLGVAVVLGALVSAVVRTRGRSTGSG